MSDLGTTFRYTNRQSDLATDDWEPGDDWGKHYTQAGFDDRDRQLEVYLATSVTTRQLVLLDAAGNVVALFGSGPRGARNLVFKHSDPNKVDSYLYWSAVGELAAGDEALYLVGPKEVGSTGDGPYLSLYNAAGNVQLAELSAYLISGVLGPGIQVDGALGGGQIVTYADNNLLASSAAAVRGNEYGTTFDEGFLGGNTNIANTGTTLVTLATINFPVAGYIEFTATILAQLLIAANSLTMTVLIDGTGVRAAQWNNPAGSVVNTIVPLTISRTVAVAAGNHTVRIDAASVATNNAFLAVAAFTGISATYHR